MKEIFIPLVEEEATHLLAFGVGFVIEILLC